MAGKSTVVKQLKLVHKQQYSTPELRTIGNGLHLNVRDCLLALVRAVEHFDGTLDDADAETVRFLRDFESSGKRMPADKYGDVMQLWESEAVQYAYSRRSEFWLLDSWKCKWCLHCASSFLRGARNTPLFNHSTPLC
jgi:hypothetical protein